MKSKKILGILLMLALMSCTVAATAQTVTAIPTTINIAHLAHREYCAGITEYNADNNTIIITLYDVEAFSITDVKHLQKGDVIISDGEEYTVETVEFESDDRGCVINGGDYESEDDSLMLMLDSYSGDYKPIGLDDITNWIPVATLTAEVPEQLYFLDEVDVDSDELLDIPIAYNASAFINMLADYEKQDVGVSFNASNIYILFDQSNQPIVVRRFYVPWQ